MKSPIGGSLRGRPLALLTSAVVAVGVISRDFVLSHAQASYAVRATGAIGATILIAIIARGNLASLGICRPQQGYWYWFRLSLSAVVGVACIIGIGMGIWWLFGNEIPIYTTRPGNFGESFVHMCVAAPIVEELLYRFALCVPAVILVRAWGAVALSGIVFAGLHFVYGTPSPENLVGGFLLAWAYLQSGSLLVPLAWHAGGNFLVLVFQVLAFYVFEALRVIG